MKELDEIIKASEDCYDRFQREGCFYCPWQVDCHDGNCIVEDTVTYLRLYKTEQGSLEGCRRLTQEAYERHSAWVENIKKAHEEYMRVITENSENTPLKWSQLQGMLGQPIWIDGSNGSMWGIVAELYKDMFGQGKVTLRTMKSGRLHLNQKNLGTTWNAYRKEKK